MILEVMHVVNFTRYSLLFLSVSYFLKVLLLKRLRYKFVIYSSTLL